MTNSADFELEVTDDTLREVQAAFDAKLLRIQHPYVFDLIRLLARFPRVQRVIALDSLRRDRERIGLIVPKTFDNVVQSSLQYYCADAAEFKKRGAPPNEALFHRPERGIWALNRDNAREWLKSHIAALPGRIDRV